MASQIEKLAELAEKGGYSKWAAEWRQDAQAIRADGGPEFFEPLPPAVDLRQQTYGLLDRVREPSTQERDRLEAMGFVFLPVDAITMEEVIRRNNKSFQHSDILDFLRQHEGWEDFRQYALPRAIEIAVNRDNFTLSGDSYTTFEERLAMMEAYSQAFIEPQFDGAKAVILPATAYAQMDLVYARRNNGAGLLSDRPVATLDKGRKGHGMIYRMPGVDIGESLGHKSYIHSAPAVIFYDK